MSVAAVTVSGAAPAPGPAAQRRLRHRARHAFFANKAAVAALAVIAALAIVAIFAPLIEPYPPNAVSISSSLQGPSGQHLLGTDELGRDLLSRLISGTRVDLWAMVQAMVIAAGAGIPLGLVSGYAGRWLDSVLSRVADALLAFPFLILALGIVGILGPSLTNAMIAVGVVLAPRFFRVARSSALAAAREGYVEAAIADGCPTWRILVRYVLPDASGPLLVQGSFSVGLIISAEASLGYLGLGARPPQASWGSMISEGFTVVNQNVFPLVPPTVLVCVAVMSAFILGDGLRDAYLGTGAGRPVSGVLAGTSAPGGGTPMLRARELTVEFGSRRVVDQVSFEVPRGATLGLVGESGSGKSVTARALLGLVGAGGRIARGQVELDGRELTALTPRELAGVRGGEIAMIFQDPRRSLDPAFRVGAQVAAVARRHLGLSRRAAWERAVELLAEAGIGDPRGRAHDYPHQFSGGMCQRVMLAMALAGSPKVLVADEPTTALDVSIQARILDLIQDLQAEHHLTVLFISHDLGVVARMCDDIAVMYAGQVVERGPARALYRSPGHPYTQALLDSLPQLGATRLRQTPGVMPAPGSWPSGCRFATRCRYARDECSAAEITLDAVRDGHAARCVRQPELTLAGVATEGAR